MLSNSIIKELSILIPCFSTIVYLIVNRDKLQPKKIQVEIANESLKTNHRNSEVLDFQVNLRLQAINGKISLRNIKLSSKKGFFDKKDLEIFKAAVIIEGDLTKYNEDEFLQFMCCIVAGSDCSKIIEYRSRFRQFIQLENLILEQDNPVYISLLGRISSYDSNRIYFLKFVYDLNGSPKDLLKKLHFNRLPKRE